MLSVELRPNQTNEGMPQLLKQQSFQKETAGALNYYQIAWDSCFEQTPNLTSSDQLRGVTYTIETISNLNNYVQIY